MFIKLSEETIYSITKNIVELGDPIYDEDNNIIGYNSSEQEISTDIKVSHVSIDNINIEKSNINIIFKFLSYILNDDGSIKEENDKKLIKYSYSNSLSIEFDDTIECDSNLSVLNNVIKIILKSILNFDDIFEFDDINNYIIIYG